MFIYTLSGRQTFDRRDVLLSRSVEVDSRDSSDAVEVLLPVLARDRLEFLHRRIEAIFHHVIEVLDAGCEILLLVLGIVCESGVLHWSKGQSRNRKSRESTQHSLCRLGNILRASHMAEAAI